MPATELPPTIPQESVREPGDSPEGSGLPASLRDWVPALTLWSVVDEHRHALVLRCLAGGRGGDWPAFCEIAGAAALVRPGPEPGTLVFSDHWAPALEEGLEVLGGARAVRERLVGCWSPDADPHVAASIVTWAIELRRWDVVEEAWIQLNVHPGRISAELLQVVSELPPEARLARPMLTWAANACVGVLASRRGAETMPAGIMLDAAMLHANWSRRDDTATETDTDTAVHAGTLRMVGQRRQPSARPGQALDAAWQTKEEVEAFIDARSREGRGPSRRAQAIFRVFSAQLALHRANPLGAIDEARWAAILADVEPLRVAARGIEQLALTMSVGSPVPASGPEPEPIPDPLGVRGMRGMGQAFSILAAGNLALRRLDRQAVERCLAALTLDDAAFIGIWAVRASIEAFRDALWGDLGEGIEKLSAEIARRSRTGREEDEMLGAAALGRARLMLLTKSGAFGAAIQALDLLPESFRRLPRARVHLWAGKFDQAIQVADAGAYDEGGGHGDRQLLLFVKAAAALLDRSADAGLRTFAIKELRRLLAIEYYLPLGVLPEPARQAILDVCAPELAGEPNYPVLLERLAGLNDVGERGVRPFRLTERELVLLPMLATELPVPEIARRLQVSVNTVRKQVVTLREKFGSDSRSELIRKARAYGAIP